MHSYPEELRLLPRWVLWKHESRDGKTTKVPYTIDGRLAKSTDPLDWSRLDDLLRSKPQGKYSGAGLVIADPYCGIDIDRGAEDGVIKPWAQEIVDRVNSYTEFSPSGDGLHIWIKGRLPGKGRPRYYQDGKVEMFDTAKYFTVTGKHVAGTPTEIHERDVTWLYDLIDEAKQPSKSVGKGIVLHSPCPKEKLMTGGWQEYYAGDHSAADLALCNVLAREHGGDAEKIDEEFRTSVLYREKWEREDYRTATIGKAIKSYESYKSTHPVVEITPIPEPPRETLTYPIDVWKDTQYYEYAEICGKHNYIPLEFFVETLKTVTGAVMGNTLTLSDIEGGIPRFYTVLITSGGGGKGTAIKQAVDVFSELWSGLNVSSPMLWFPTAKIEDIPYKGIGACNCSFASAAGMQRVLAQEHKRWLQVFEELSTMTESSNIDGSGQSLLAANRQLYDGESFTTTATAKRDAAAGRAQNSILAGTTRELWEDMFSRAQVAGSGLFQRFNLIAVPEDTRKVGTLLKPKLDAFKAVFVSRLMELEMYPLELKSEPGTITKMDEWFQDSFPSGEIDPDDYGRLNILAWRNAMHLAWLRRKTTIGMKEIDDAIALSDYQFKARRMYKPAVGENKTALVEEKIKKLVYEKKQIKIKDARRRLHAERYGISIWSRAIDNLVKMGDVDLRSDKADLPGAKASWLTMPTL